MEFIETSEMQEMIQLNLGRYHDVLKSQIFLQEQGVSFSYSDSLSYFDRLDLIDEYSEFIKMKNEKNQEAMNKNRG